MASQESSHVNNKPGYGRLSVDITDEIINSAIRMDSANCMISNALKAQYPELTNVRTNLALSSFTCARLGKRYHCPLPARASSALALFDAGHKVEPFKLILRAAQITKSGSHGRGNNRGPRKVKIKSNGETPIVEGGHPPVVAQMTTKRMFGARAYVADYEAMIAALSAAVDNKKEEA